MMMFHLQFFHDDIHYLLSMENLWKKRKPPTPLDLSHLPDSGEFDNLMHDSALSHRVSYWLFFRARTTLDPYAGAFL